MFTKLIGLQYNVVYKKGSENSVADALSRRPHSTNQMMALSVCTPTWLAEVRASYDLDPQPQTMITKLLNDSGVVSHFSLVDGILKYKRRIWVGQVPSLWYKLTSALHNSPIGGHSGAHVTLRN
jgi:hypothetical protein